nr:uncharacterized protein LOC109164037 [Ipomoea batatas]
MYAKTRERLRDSQWAELCSVSDRVSFGVRLSMVDDFNCLLSVDEKKCGLPYPHRKTTNFRECISTCDLIESTTYSSSFTWWNERHREFDMWMRLDRFLYTSVWELKFRTLVQHLSMTMSDHYPLLISSKGLFSTEVGTFDLSKVDCVSLLVTDDDNAMVTTVPKEDEIKNVVFAINFVSVIGPGNQDVVLKLDMAKDMTKSRLRQGGSLSPSLFIIAAEVLSMFLARVHLDESIPNFSQLAEVFVVNELMIEISALVETDKESKNEVEESDEDLDQFDDSEFDMAQEKLNPKKRVRSIKANAAGGNVEQAQQAQEEIEIVTQPDEILSQREAKHSFA